MTDQPTPKDRPTYLVTLRAEPDIDGIRNLRLALKFLLRRFHLRCIAVEERRS